jgi:hypothetical protein
MNDRNIQVFFILYFVIVFLFYCKREKNPAAYGTTKSKAIQIVLSDIIASDTLDKGLYIFPEIIEAGDSVYCTSDTNYRVDYNSWFLFIDDLLTADWAHPCRFVFVDHDQGAYEIFPEMWPPQYYLESELEVVKEWHP